MGLRRVVLLPEEVAADFASTDYTRAAGKEDVKQPADFYIDLRRPELSVRLLPAIYPHHIVGPDEAGRVVNISICGQSGRSGITTQDAKDLCGAIHLDDALIFDNGNDVFARYEGRHPISHRNNSRQTRLSAALHFADLLVQRAKSRGRNLVYYVRGQTSSGRHLFCVVIQFPNGKGYPVTARPMTRKEKERYRQWRRR